MSARTERMSDHDRLAALEEEVRALKRRLEVLEKGLNRGPEHSEDRAAVREKVRFDWQA
ncbi:MAG TPA: hypothetical protein VMH78_00400 [Thermoplasmata archaeon]|nr:hypothetical protein [Thermoplasmata archaeon]